MTAPAASIIGGDRSRRLGTRQVRLGYAGHSRDPVALCDRLKEPGYHASIGPAVGEQHDLLALADAKALIEKASETVAVHGLLAVRRRLPSASASAANMAYTLVAS